MKKIFISFLALMLVVGTAVQCDKNDGPEVTGQENTNTGDDNTGDDNTGNDNTGDDNTGDDNTGDDNTGDDNTGNDNTGDDNTGDDNTGDDNTGDDNQQVSGEEVWYGSWKQTHDKGNSTAEIRLEGENGLYFVLTTIAEQEAEFFIPANYDEQTGKLDLIYQWYENVPGYLASKYLSEDSYLFYCGFPMVLNPASGKYTQYKGADGKDYADGSVLCTLTLSEDKNTATITPGVETFVYFSVYSTTDGKSWSSRLTRFYINEGTSFERVGS